MASLRESVSIGVHLWFFQKGALTTLLVAAIPLGAAEGCIRFSDGTEAVGTVRLASDLRVAVKEDWVSIAAARVRAIDLTVEHEELAASWRFPEAGSTRKEIIGQPYPTRSFTTRVTLAGGQVIAGHLYPLAVYVEAPTGTRKVSLLAKQVGKPGETLAALTYPLRIEVPGPAEESLPLALALPAGTTPLGLVALPWLTPMTITAGRLPGGVVPPAVVAARRGDDVVVAWPVQDPEIRARVEAAAALVRNFEDQHRVVAVCRQGDVDQALVVLWRTGATVGDKPWRVEVWRFRTDPVSGGGVLAARGMLVRGIGAPPTVLPETAWWSQVVRDGVIHVGEVAP